MYCTESHREQAILDAEQLEALAKALLGALRPSLKAPMTAVLCDAKELRIVQNANGYYVEGYVNSQNGYGALIATDFSANVTCQNGQWIVLNTKVGAKVAKTYAKTFAQNYVVIMILTIIGGAFLYFLITQMVGM